ncbi:MULTISPECIES: GNAT family N-acetyltransferase [unclassified Curtobacterium]|uniref:GNAT family N-acetyltransferase n=1 Tax=unclassified Curtobacterium TaxID=257496 RepID=UPI0008262025|nr:MULTISPECIES: GNAT family N-acetyltransferase [unclassified Curtobacterium]WIA97127.1 GNAT family N-acetyltransferase [Curtobacterium sp. MCBA15_004]WIB00455.1 GNAT family N-acetyltransferase [Curtobacterium sp. MCBA15_012]
MPIIVRPAAAHELPAVATVLAEAFADDPVLHAFRPARPGEDRTAVLTGLFAALIRSVPERCRAVDVAVDTTSGGVVGAAFWEAPRPHPGSVLAFLRQAPALLGVLGVGGALRALRHLRRMDRARPDAPHWYLAEIGVSAAARGQGVGGLLLEHALDRVDGQRRHAYLESSTPLNRRLYRRHGFGEGAPITGLGTAAPVSMWRPAVS